MRLVSSLRSLMHGGAGVAFAVLLPRALSLAAQWALALSAGPAAVAALANYMYRGTVVVALVAAGLAPTLVRRTRPLMTRPGRALAGGALAMMAALASLLTLAHELILGLPGAAAVITASYSALSLFASASGSLWPVWQLQGRYLRTLVVLLAFSPGMSMVAALAGNAAAVSIAIGLAGAAPALLLLGPTRIRRAARYGALLIRRSVPYSIAGFSTVVVYPIALSAGQRLLGGHRVGQQVLYWSLIAVLSQGAQAFAARAVAGTGAPGDEATQRARALRAWLPSAAAFSLVGVLLYVLFVVPIPWLPYSGVARDAMTPTMLVAAMGPVLADSMCVYFSGPRSRRALPIGSAVSSACVAGCLLLEPAPVIRHFGVFGPSVLVGVARLAFVLDAQVRRYALCAMVLLVSAFVVTLGLGRGLDF